jgi:hypothetical protein
VSAIYFDEPTEVTPELAEAIGCGLPEMVRPHPAVPPDMAVICTGVDAETRVLTFSVTTPVQAFKAEARQLQRAALSTLQPYWLPQPRWLLPGL